MPFGNRSHIVADGRQRVLTDSGQEMASRLQVRLMRRASPLWKRASLLGRLVIRFRIYRSFSDGLQGRHHLKGYIPNARCYCSSPQQPFRKLHVKQGVTALTLRCLTACLKPPGVIVLLLLIVHHLVLDPFAFRISSARGDRPGLAIGGHNNPTTDRHLSIFLDGHF